MPTTLPVPVNALGSLAHIIAKGAHEPSQAASHTPPLPCCRGQVHISGALRSAATKRLPDSYLDMKPWGKGAAFINGFNLGWYWPLLGPVETLYVPGAVLHPGANDLVLLEAERVPEDHTGASPCLAEMHACARSHQSQ